MGKKEKKGQLRGREKKEENPRGVVSWFMLFSNLPLKKLVFVLYLFWLHLTAFSAD